MPAVFDYYPYDSGLGANSTEARWRSMMKNMMSTGIVVQGSAMDGDDCAVTAGTGMTVNISTGIAWIQGHMFEHTGTAASLSISNNSSGSTRTDLIVIRNDFINNTISYLVLQGTTTPVQSSTVWDLPLATVAVPNGAASSASFTITDKRVSANHYTFNPSCQLSNTTNRTVTAGTTVTLKWNFEEFDPMQMHKPGGDPEDDRITIKETGFYYVEGMLYWTGASAINNIVNFSIFRNRGGTVSQVARDTRYFTSTQGVQSCSKIVNCQAGDFLYIQATNSSAISLDIDAANPYSPYFSVFKAGMNVGI